LSRGFKKEAADTDRVSEVSFSWTPCLAALQSCSLKLAESSEEVDSLSSASARGRRGHVRPRLRARFWRLALDVETVDEQAQDRDKCPRAPLPATSLLIVGAMVSTLVARIWPSQVLRSREKRGRE